MIQQPNFRIAKTWDNKTQFIDDKVTITIDHFTHFQGKHQILNPKAANAQFMCCGRLYIVTNMWAIPTVEDWYCEDLLPKMLLLTALECPVTIDHNNS